MQERSARLPIEAAEPKRDKTARRGPIVQAKLTVGAVNDPAEREADRVADAVMRMIDGAVTATPDLALPATRIARSSTDIPVGAAGGDLDPSTAGRIRSARGGGAAIEAGTRARMESAFGADFGDVRIHRDSAVAPEISARAFTAGADVHFAAGEYQPGSRAGERLLAHELVHVVQQDGSIHRKYGKPNVPQFKKFVEDKRHADAVAATPQGQPAPAKAVFKNVKELDVYLQSLSVDDFKALAQKWITDGKVKGVTVDEIAKYHEYPLSGGTVVSRQKRSQMSYIVHEDDEWVIGLEAHQNKHQTTKIPMLGDYPGKAGDKFNSTVDLAWHQKHAVRDLKTWATRLAFTDAKPKVTGSITDVKDKSGYNPEAKYYATAGLLDGEDKKFIEYHCYPRKD